MTEPSALTREQVEMELMYLLNGHGVGGNLLAHDAAQRARVEELEAQVDGQETRIASLRKFLAETITARNKLEQQLAEAMKEREALREALEAVPEYVKRMGLVNIVDVRDNRREFNAQWLPKLLHALEPPAPPAADTGERP